MSLFFCLDVDYRYFAQNITIPQDSTMSFRQCVNITIIGDVFIENNETILFMLTDNEGNGDILDDTAAMVYVNIIDNDGMCLGVRPYLKRSIAAMAHKRYMLVIVHQLVSSINRTA